MVERSAVDDLVIVGAGPAGIAGAVAAAEAGARVCLIDEGARAGGQIWRHDSAEGEAVTPLRKRALLERLAALGDRVEHLAGHAVVDARLREGGGAVVQACALDEAGAPLLEREAPALLLACGARERFLPFPGWTLPGVLGVGGLQALAKQGLELAGKRVVIAGSGPLLLAVAADLRARGAELVAIVEQASRRAVLGLGAAALTQRSKRAQAAGLAAKLARVRRLWSTWPIEASGDGRVESLRVRDANGREQTLSCELLACGFGLVPELRLARLLGCAGSSAGLEVDARLQTSRAGIFAAGEQCGIGGIEAALIEGELAGRAAIGASVPAALVDARVRERSFAERLEQAYALRRALAELAAPDTPVCRCEDVTLASVQRWASADARTAKLHTRCAMGSCQGRVCEPALEFLFGWQPSRCRPPLSPIPLSALTAGLAGPTRHPTR